MATTTPIPGCIFCAHCNPMRQTACGLTVRKVYDPFYGRITDFRTCQIERRPLWKALLTFSWHRGRCGFKGRNFRKREDL